LLSFDPQSFSSKRKNRKLPILRFVLEELLVGAASKEAEKLKCPQGRELSGFAGT